MMSKFIPDFFQAVRAFIYVPGFIRDHQLWKGFTQHRLVVVALVFISILFSASIWQIVAQWWNQMEINQPWDLGIHFAGLMGDLASGGYDMVFAGGYKYLVLIFMELLIFHMALRTNEIITGQREALSAGIFFRAQLRMIKVSIFVFTLEIIASILLSIVLGIIGLSVLKTGGLFLVQCFFLGFAIIDNYHEINQLAIKESFNRTKWFVGTALGIGLILYLLILIPIVGAVAGPLVGMIAATLAMYSEETDQPIQLIVESASPD